PTIGRLDLSCIVIHRAKSVCDDIVEVADGSFAQAAHVKSRRAAPEAAAYRHAVAGAYLIMARSTEDGVSLTSAHHNVRSDFERKCRRELPVYAAAKKMIVFVQEASSDYSNG